ncbi:hypothetical protein HDU93_002511 [Gonapodya sp. JEL0774]|nr:hypothetical protein HDU93_002511 [Gonapodya sp. JEL0774]
MSEQSEKVLVVKEGNNDNEGLDEPDLSLVEEEHEFTWRASVVGSVLGCVVAASNFYLGLKVGWTFGASIFGAIFTFGILMPISRTLSGTYFGPKENVTAQTAASTAGGLSVGMITAIPAMYRLGLLSDDVTKDVARLTLWTIAASFYGLFFAIPLRKYFVLQLGDKLPFPTPTATANTIKILHSSSKGTRIGLESVRAMAVAFIISTVTNLISYWIYIFDKIHIIYWIGRATGSSFLQRADVTWGFYFTPNFAFFGAGLITPPNVVFSFLAGSFIAYGIGGPIMLDNGYLVSALGWGRTGNGSAQSWWFWPGMALMLVTAFADIAVHWRVVWHAMRSFAINGVDRLEAWREGGKAVDPVPDYLQIPFSWWAGGLTCSVTLTCSIMGFYFGIPLGQSILALIFAFFLSIVGAFAAGQTDINPISTLAKVVQLTFAHMPASSLQDLQRSNLLCAAVTSSSACQSVDMLSDLKTGHIVGASPRSQFLAQLVGSFFAVIMNVSLFVLFAKAYPCIVIIQDTCEFGLSPVLSWQNVTILLTQNPSIPLSSIITAAGCSVLACVYVFGKSLIPTKYEPYLPNLNAAGLGFLVPQPSTPLAMALAVVLGWLWERHHKKSHDKFRSAVAAGAIAGVGIVAYRTRPETRAGMSTSGQVGNAGNGGLLRNGVIAEPATSGSEFDSHAKQRPVTANDGSRFLQLDQSQKQKNVSVAPILPLLPPVSPTTAGTVTSTPPSSQSSPGAGWDALASPGEHSPVIHPRYGPSLSSSYVLASPPTQTSTSSTEKCNSPRTLNRELNVHLQHASSLLNHPSINHLEHYRNSILSGFAAASGGPTVSPLSLLDPSPGLNDSSPSVYHRHVFAPELTPVHLASFVPFTSPVLDLGDEPDSLIHSLSESRSSQQMVPFSTSRASASVLNDGLTHAGVFPEPTSEASVLHHDAGEANNPSFPTAKHRNSLLVTSSDHTPSFVHIPSASTTTSSSGGRAPGRLPHRPAPPPPAGYLNDISRATTHVTVDGTTEQDIKGRRPIEEAVSASPIKNLPALPTPQLSSPTPSHSYSDDFEPATEHLSRSASPTYSYSLSIQSHLSSPVQLELKPPTPTATTPMRCTSPSPSSSPKTVSPLSPPSSPSTSAHTTPARPTPSLNSMQARPIATPARWRRQTTPPAAVLSDRVYAANPVGSTTRVTANLEPDCGDDEESGGAGNTADGGGYSYPTTTTPAGPWRMGVPGGEWVEFDVEDREEGAAQGLSSSSSNRYEPGFGGGLDGEQERRQDPAEYFALLADKRRGGIGRLARGGGIHRPHLTSPPPRVTSHLSSPAAMRRVLVGSNSGSPSPSGSGMGSRTPSPSSHHFRRRSPSPGSLSLSHGSSSSSQSSVRSPSSSVGVADLGDADGEDYEGFFSFERPSSGRIVQTYGVGAYAQGQGIGYGPTSVPENHGYLGHHPGIPIRPRASLWTGTGANGSGSGGTSRGTSTPPSNGTGTASRRPPSAATRSENGNAGGMDAKDLQRLIREHTEEERRRKEAEELKEKIRAAMGGRGISAGEAVSDKALQKGGRLGMAMERRRRRAEKLAAGKKAAEGATTTLVTAAPPPLTLEVSHQHSSSLSVGDKNAGDSDAVAVTVSVVSAPESTGGMVGDSGKGKKPKGKRKGKKKGKKGKKGAAGGNRESTAYGGETNEGATKTADPDESEEESEPTADVDAAFVGINLGVPEESGGSSVTLVEDSGEVGGGAQDNETQGNGHMLGEAKVPSADDFERSQSKERERDHVFSRHANRWAGRIANGDSDNRNPVGVQVPAGTATTMTSSTVALSPSNELSDVAASIASNGSELTTTGACPPSESVSILPVATRTPEPQTGYREESVEYMAVSPMIPSWSYADLVQTLAKEGWQTGSTARTIVDDERLAAWNLSPIFLFKLPEERWTRSAVLVLELHRTKSDSMDPLFSVPFLARLLNALPVDAVPTNISPGSLFGRVTCSTKYDEELRFKVVDIMSKVPTRMGAESKIASRPPVLWSGDGVPQIYVVACRSSHGVALMRRLMTPPSPLSPATPVYLDPPTRFELLGIKCADSLRLNQAKMVTPLPVGHPGYNKSLNSLMARVSMESERLTNPGFTPFVQWIVLAFRGFCSSATMETVLSKYRSDVGTKPESFDIVVSPTAEAGYDWTATFFRDAEIVQDYSLYAKGDVWAPEKMLSLHPMRWAYAAPAFETTICIVRESHIIRVGDLMASLTAVGVTLVGLRMTTLGMVEAARMVAAEAEREPGISSQARQTFQTWHADKAAIILCVLGINVIRQVQQVLQKFNADLLCSHGQSAGGKRPISARERLLMGVFSPTSLLVATRFRQSLFPHGVALGIRSKIVDGGLIQVLRPVVTSESSSRVMTPILPPSSAAALVVLPPTSSSYSQTVEDWSRLVSRLLMTSQSGSDHQSEIYVLGLYLGPLTEQQTEKLLMISNGAHLDSVDSGIRAAVQRGPCFATVVGRKGKFAPMADRLKEALLFWNAPVSVPEIATTQQAALEQISVIFSSLVIPSALRA